MSNGVSGLKYFSVSFQPHAVFPNGPDTSKRGSFLLPNIDQVPKCLRKNSRGSVMALRDQLLLPLPFTSGSKGCHALSLPAGSWSNLFSFRQCQGGVHNALLCCLAWRLAVLQYTQGLPESQSSSCQTCSFSCPPLTQQSFRLCLLERVSE